LCHRLDIIEIKAVPLQEHREDIPLLIKHVLLRTGRTVDINRIFKQEALVYLQALDWPGNVRQLNNTIEKAMLFWNGELIGVDGLKVHINGSGKGYSLFFDTRKTLKDAANDFEREFIKKIIDECGGNISATAERLDLQRPYLYEKLKKLGLER